jgi:hypothetical protein
VPVPLQIGNDAAGFLSSGRQTVCFLMAKVEILVKIFIGGKRAGKI